MLKEVYERFINEVPGDFRFPTLSTLTHLVHKPEIFEHLYDELNRLLALPDVAFFKVMRMETAWWARIYLCVNRLFSQLCLIFGDHLTARKAYNAIDRIAVRYQVVITENPPEIQRLLSLA